MTVLVMRNTIFPTLSCVKSSTSSDFTLGNIEIVSELARILRLPVHTGRHSDRQEAFMVFRDGSRPCIHRNADRNELALLNINVKDIGHYAAAYNKFRRPV